MRHPFLLLVISSLLLTACGKPPPAAPGGGMPPPTVGVAAPLIRDLPELREYTGRIEAIQVVDLRARIGGTIQRVVVQDGAAVKAGDLLFEIDPAPQKAVVARGEAEVARAQSEITRSQADVARSQAALFQARQQFERAKRLVADQVVSRQQYDDAEAAVRIAEAAVNITDAAVHSAESALAATRAALETARIDLGFTRITAPIAGRIGRAFATPGNVVQASGVAMGTLLATLVAVDPLYVAFDVDEATWRRTSERLRTSADGGARVPVSIGVPGEQGFPHEGTVSFVDNQIDPASGAIRIRATVPNPKLELTPGAFARVQLEVAPPRRVVLVDERTVQAQLTTRYVLTVDAQGKTLIRPVSLGAAVGTWRVVESGLTGDERIAVNNLAKIFFPGMPVSPVPASMETLQNLAPAAAAPAPVQGSKP